MKNRLILLLLIIPLFAYSQKPCEIPCIDFDVCGFASDSDIEDLQDQIDDISFSVDVEKCTGDFENGSGRTGWWSGWTAVTQNANVARTEGDWANISAVRRSPNCITDMTVNFDFGNHYLLTRRNRTYVWADYRLLVNGVAVWTKTYHKYWYKDTTNDRNPDIVRSVQYNINSFGSGHGYRLNVPAGATIQVQARERFQVVAAQPFSYFRYIPGLRSEPNFSFNTRDEITDVQVASNVNSSDTVYWVLEELMASTYGVNEPFPGAKTYSSRSDYNDAIKSAELKAEKERIEFQDEIDKMIAEADSPALDEFFEIRALTADQIRGSYTVDENKQWAKKLGLRNYSRLREPELSTMIFEALKIK